MKKENSLIVGSGVIGAYLAKLLLAKKYNIIVTTRRNKKNFHNYKKLNIEKKIIFEQLNVSKKNNIFKIIKKYNPTNIFYFSGQSSLTKSIELKKETNDSNYVGAKNFLEVLYNNKIKSKFFKANSGYIFDQKNTPININSKISSNKNPYIQSQIRAYKEVKRFRKKGLKCYSLIFLQVESALRSNHFFIKKVCEHAKYKKTVSVGNLNTIRDYSWAPEIVKGIFYSTKIKARDIILSSGQGISGKEILKIAYKLNNLDYNDYFFINKKFIRKNEIKKMIGSKKNHSILTKRFNFRIKTNKKKLIKKIYNSI